MNRLRLILQQFCSSRAQKLLIVLLTLLAYSEIYKLSFVNFDDDFFLLRNSRVTRGLSWAGLKWAFSGHFLFNLKEVWYWAPIAFLSHMLDFQIYGFNPEGHHLTNLFIHIINSLLVFHLFKKITGKELSSLFCSLIFAIHPFNVEAVCWIIERKGVLAMTFALLSILSYLNFQKKSRRSYYILSLVLFQLSLMTKVTMAVLPGLLLLLDFSLLKRMTEPKKILAACMEKVPFGILALIGIIQSILNTSKFGSIVSLHDASGAKRLTIVLTGYCRYLLKFFIPHDFAVFYPLPREPLPILNLLILFAFLAGVLMLLFRLRTRIPFGLMGYLWFLSSLIPVIGILQTGGQAYADRYFYLPMLGVLLSFQALFDPVLEMISRRVTGTILPVLSALLVATCLLITRNQVLFWQDSISLFTHATEVTKNNSVAETNLGIAYLQTGDLKNAEEHLFTAIDYNEFYMIPYYGLGVIKERQKQPEQAIICYKKAIELNPQYPLPYSSMGEIYLEKGNTNAAINYLQMSIEKDVSETSAYTLAKLYAKLNENEKALDYFGRVLRNKPDWPQAYYEMAIIQDRLGRTSEAESSYQKALKLNPDHFDSLYNLGNMYMKRQDWTKAAECYESLLNAQRFHVKAMNNLGIVYSRTGQIDKALVIYKKILNIKPDSVDAYYNSGLAELRKGNRSEAKKMFQLALKINPQHQGSKIAIHKLELLEKASL